MKRADFTDTANGRYRIRNTRRHGAELGPCEVCKQDCAEPHILNQERRYDGGFTYHGVRSFVFGHPQCLETLILH